MLWWFTPKQVLDSVLDESATFGRGVMLRLSKDHCLGNKWPAIELEPVDTAYFLPILLHFSQAYHFAWPQIMDDIDGYTAFFMINHSVALMLLDTWTFSIAFGVEAVRGQVFADLSALSPDYFGV